MGLLSRSWMVGLFVGASALGGLVALIEAPEAALAGSCGDPGMPACPLQSYMRGRIAGPLSQKDMATVAVSLDGVAPMQPDPSWATWSTYAKAGADAARQNDVEKLRAACKSCHDDWRATYRKQFRQRPLP